MINYTEISDPISYDNLRYNFLVLVESLEYSPYKDSNGTPHIGIGFNLKDTAVRSAVLAEFGFGVSRYANYSDAYAREQSYMGTIAEIAGRIYASDAALQADLDKVMYDRAHDSVLAAADAAIGDGHVRSEKFAFVDAFGNDNEAMVRDVYSRIIDNYERTVTNWLGTAISNSQERVALVSLAYQGWIQIGKSQQLKTAILNGDRAEAWYQIRYATDREYRRYRESDLFGLYNDSLFKLYTDGVNVQFPTGPNDTEDADAKAAYRMFTRHANTPITTTVWINGVKTTQTYQGIVDYENSLSPAGANSYIIQTELHPAYQYLLTNYVRPVTGVDISWDNIYVGEDQSSIYFNHTDSDTNLTGSAYNDLIMGESGDDILDGKGGTNVLNGGTGLDVYYYHAGDNAHDYIVDSDGQGEIVYVDANGTTHMLAAGVHQSTDPTGQYESVGGDNVIYRQNGADLDITMPDGGIITVKDYSAGNLHLSMFDTSLPSNGVFFPGTHFHDAPGNDSSIGDYRGYDKPVTVIGPTAYSALSGFGGVVDVTRVLYGSDFGDKLYGSSGMQWMDPTISIYGGKIGVREQFSLMNKSIWLSHSNSLEYAPRTQGGRRGA